MYERLSSGRRKRGHHVHTVCSAVARQQLHPRHCARHALPPRRGYHPIRLLAHQGLRVSLSFCSDPDRSWIYKLQITNYKLQIT